MALPANVKPTDEAFAGPETDPLQCDPPIGVVSEVNGLALAIGDKTSEGEWIRYDGPVVDMG